MNLCTRQLTNLEMLDLHEGLPNGAVRTAGQGSKGWGFNELVYEAANESRNAWPCTTLDRMQLGLWALLHTCSLVLSHCVMSREMREAPHTTVNIGLWT